LEQFIVLYLLLNRLAPLLRSSRIFGTAPRVSSPPFPGGLFFVSFKMRYVV
jgi:hypothetical protein